MAKQQGITVGFTAFAGIGDGKTILRFLESIWRGYQKSTRTSHCKYSKWTIISLTSKLYSKIDPTFVRQIVEELMNIDSLAELYQKLHLTKM